MRRIDSKFHVDGDKIVKTSNGEVLPGDEPLFLIRARDYLALPLLRHYAAMSRSAGCTDYHMIGILSTITDFEKFTRQHPDRMKQPGITRGL